MITLVEALNYRCLRYVQRPLSPFHVLVGPNASGKTTFLDVIGFLRDVVSNGLDAALSERAPNPQELLFRGQGDRLELAVEARVPDALRELTSRPELDTVRYEMGIGFDETQRQFEFKAETLLLKKATVLKPSQRSFFPMPVEWPGSLLAGSRGGRASKAVINKVPGGNDNFYSETYGRSGKGLDAIVQAGLSKVGPWQSSGRRKLLSRGHVVSGTPYRRSPEVRTQQPHHQATPVLQPGFRVFCLTGQICPGLSLVCSEKTRNDTVPG